MSNPLFDVLWRADIYRLLALILDRPSDGSRETVQELAAEILADDHIQKDNHGLNTWLAELVAQLATLTLDEWSAEYHRLFVNEVFVPPSEGSYGLVERGAILGDVSGFYKAFCMQVSDEVGPPDQMKIEMMFLCLLALKEANAIQQQLVDKLEITRDAEKKFLDDHVGRWLPQFSERLWNCAHHPFYRAASRLMMAWLAAECELWKITPVPYPMQLSPVAAEEGHVECPFAGDATCSSDDCLV